MWASAIWSFRFPGGYCPAKGDDCFLNREAGGANAGPMYGPCRIFLGRSVFTALRKRQNPI